MTTTPHTTAALKEGATVLLASKHNIGIPARVAVVQGLRTKGNPSLLCCKHELLGKVTFCVDEWCIRPTKLSEQDVAAQVPLNKIWAENVSLLLL